LKIQAFFRANFRGISAENVLGIFIFYTQDFSGAFSVYVGNPVMHCFLFEVSAS
jgi:hypothetical protein